MSKLIDLTGQRFGRLTVTKRDDDYVFPNGKRLTRWECICDCGATVVVFGGNIRKGVVRSCGCLKSDISKELSTTHGLSRSKLYGIWRGMKNRCYLKTNRYYKYYGGRGITVCPEWLQSFKAFYDWACENGYQENGQKKHTHY